MSSDNEQDVKPTPEGTPSHQSSPSLPDSPSPQKKTPASPSKSKSTPKKRTAAPSVKTEVTGPSFPSKKSPAKKAGGGGGGGAGKAGATNITMAADVVKHALTLINADELKVVAEKLGVDPVKLRDSWRKRWAPRVIKAVESEFGDASGGDKE